MTEQDGTAKTQASNTLLRSPLLKGCLWTLLAFVLLYLVCYIQCEYRGFHSFVGRDAHEALLDRDAERLLALVSPEEVKANNLTEENLQNFIDNYVFRDVSGATFGDDYSHTPEWPSSTSSIYRDYRLEDGRIMHVSFDATREGAVVGVVTTLFWARVSVDEDPGTLAFDWTTAANAIDRDIDILNRTGIRGVYYDGAFSTWKEYAAGLRELAKRYPGS